MMSFSASVLSPLLLPHVVEPLLDFKWHYDCVGSPTSVFSSFSSPPTPQSPPHHDLQPEASVVSPPPDSFNASCRSPAAAAINTATDSTHSSTTRLDNSNYKVKDVEESSNPSCKSTSPTDAIETSRLDNIGSPTSSKSRVPAVQLDRSHGLSKPELNISYAERRWLQKVFDTFDENSDGKITKDELGRSLEKLGIHMTDESILSLLSSTNPKVEGHVDIEEFLLMYSSTCSFIEDSDEDTGADDDQDLLEAFNIFDKDQNGFISPDELQSVLCGLGFQQAQELDACVEMIKRVDEDGNGQVDFSEFKRMLT